MVRITGVHALALASLVWLVDCHAVAAQSLLDGLSGPASRVATLGSWATKIARPRPADPWKASVTPFPATSVANPLVVATVTLRRPYSLHGPVMGGATPERARPALSGIASYYGAGAALTAAGEQFDPTAMTAAHPSLPFGTKVRVTRVDTGDSVVVRINDRGPFKPGRIIDLTQGAAENLGMTNAGLTEVRLDVLDR